MEHSDKLDEIGPALLAVQGKVSGVEKNSSNPAFKSRYADLAATNEATREHLTAAGIVCTQWPGRYDAENRSMEMTTMLLHAASQQWMKGTITIPLQKVDAQGYGSCCTYARRYALQAALGLSPEDDDGNAASQPTARQAPQTAPAALKSSAQAKRDGDWEALTAEVDACMTVEDIDRLVVSRPWQEAVKQIPRAWLEPLQDYVQSARKDRASPGTQRALASMPNFDKLEPTHG